VNRDVEPSRNTRHWVMRSPEFFLSILTAELGTDNMIKISRKRTRVTSIRLDRIRILSVDEIESVAGGINPQPLPPRED
jgi:hypothetical protein